MGGEMPAHRVEPLGVMQKTIAEHLLASHVGTAHVSTWGQVDASALLAAAERRRNEGASAGVTPLMAAALVRSLLAHPRMNAHLVDGNLMLFDEVNLGLAVSLPDGGLIVPVIHGADRHSVNGLGEAIARKMEAARTRRLSRTDLLGGTFTLSNWGALRTACWATPLINAPQVAILGVGRVFRAPWVTPAGELVVRPVLPLSLTYDHRAVNGMAAGEFLESVADSLQDPEALGEEGMSHG